MEEEDITGPICHHYLKRDELFNETEKHKKILIIAPRRSGKTIFLRDYCNLYRQDKSVLYYTLPMRKSDQNLIRNRIRLGNIEISSTGSKTNKIYRDVYDDNYLMIFDESAFMNNEFLSDHLEDDAYMISITSVSTDTSNDFIELHRKNGFHVIYTSTDCDDIDHCRYKDRCEYCYCLFEEGWIRCPYCLYGI
jgi:predicted AAA+ superfamily ATPase